MSEADAGSETAAPPHEERLLVKEGEPTLDIDESGQPASPEDGGPLDDGSTGPDPEEAAEEDDGEAPTRGRGMRLSRKGAKFIGTYEGYVGKPYNDPVGHCTVGYGHLLHLGACTSADFSRYGSGLDAAEALRLLRRDAQDAAGSVRRLGISFTQPQFDALVSFTFNLGGGWTSSSGLLRALQAGDLGSVPRELSRWVYAGSPPRVLPGLVTRRRAEGRLFSEGVY
jgi:GH24 family phage-related lysozyme (muramidase)